MKRLIITSFLFTLLAACSSKPTAKIDFNPDINFQQLTSYQFSPTRDNSIDANPIMIHRIQTAINSVMVVKGLTGHKFIDMNSADINIQVGFSEQEQQNNPSFSIGIGTSRFGGNSGATVGINTNIPINSDKDIMTKIVIDMSNKNKVIWHGSDTFETSEDFTTEQKNQAVIATVKNILANFPPEKASN